jgi:hypothetical protein
VGRGVCTECTLRKVRPWLVPVLCLFFFFPCLSSGRPGWSREHEHEAFIELRGRKEEDFHARWDCGLWTEWPGPGPGNAWHSAINRHVLDGGGTGGASIGDIAAVVYCVASGLDWVRFVSGLVWGGGGGSRLGCSVLLSCYDSCCSRSRTSLRLCGSATLRLCGSATTNPTQSNPIRTIRGS